MGTDLRRQAFEEALAEAVRERERLDVVIAFLSERLGLPSPPLPDGGFGPLPPAGPRVDTRTGRVDPASLVMEGEFLGQSSTSAAMNVLRKVGKPNALKTKVLLEAVRKGGIPVKDGGTLYRSMARNSKLKRVGKGQWGLAEWYPAGAKLSARSDGRTTAEEPENGERPDPEESSRST